MNEDAVKQKFYERAEKVKCVISDVDGVLTDGKLFIDSQGQETKSFHIRDGQAIKMLQTVGIEFAVISNRASAAVETRMRDLGVEHVFLGQDDKLSVFRSLLKTLNIAADEVAYIGDDWADVSVMKHVGLAVTVADAPFGVADFADWQTTYAGGEGALRELVDGILAIQDKFAEATEVYWHDKH